MPKRSTPRRTESGARAAFMGAAEHLWDAFNAWYEAHREATFDEMEQELGRLRQVLMGDTLVLALQQGDLGASAESPSCERCGRTMEFQGYRRKEVHGLQGDCQIPRAYYLCPHCDAGLFPPGPPPAAEAGSVE
jgi:hypothetical protein